MLRFEMKQQEGKYSCFLMILRFFFFFSVPHCHDLAGKKLQTVKGVDQSLMVKVSKNQGLSRHLMLMLSCQHPYRYFLASTVKLRLSCFQSGLKANFVLWCSEI